MALLFFSFILRNNKMSTIILIYFCCSHSKIPAENINVNGALKKKGGFKLFRGHEIVKNFCAAFIVEGTFQYGVTLTRCKKDFSWRNKRQQNEVFSVGLQIKGY